LTWLPVLDEMGVADISDIEKAASDEDPVVDDWLELEPVDDEFDVPEDDDEPVEDDDEDDELEDDEELLVAADAI
jgi:hypothetical protein